jgi:phospholipid/cholesterol/gamma-HCH transport system substrate-binding protein
VKSKELKVGVFTAMTLVLLYFGFDFLKGKDFLQRSHKYYVIYANVDKLQQSNPVLVNGYAVGRVSNIRIMQEQNNDVLVELDIDSEVTLGDSTKAILDSDFLGNKSILLSIGTITVVAEPGDTLLPEVTPSLQALITQSAEPVADNLQTTIRKLNTTLDNLANNSRGLDSIFARFKTTQIVLNKALVSSNEQIGEVARSFKVTTENLDTALNALQPTLLNLAVITDSLKRVELNKTIAKTQEAITRLNATLDKLTQNDNTAGRLLNDDSLYVNLNQVLLSIDSLAKNFNNNPKHFMSPLGKSSKKIERDRRSEQMKPKN